MVTREVEKRVTNKVSCSGINMTDKHTHYELCAYIGPSPITITIPGYIEKEFREKYGYPISECKRFSVMAEFIRNDQKVEECRDQFKPPGHLMTSLTSLDQIIVED
jgi:hypothetical protein